MAIDVKSYKKKVLNQKLNFNLVPFIDILFTVMIFLVVTSNFAATDMPNDATDASTQTGKPNVTDVSGSADYYVMPVAGLHKVTVNGHDMSSLIRHHSIAVHAKVIDNGQITIKPGEIIIITPSDVSYKDAVAAPR